MENTKRYMHVGYRMNYQAIAALAAGRFQTAYSVDPWHSPASG
jgi:hypothetical protein